MDYSHYNFTTVEAMTKRLGGYMVHPKLFSLRSATGSNGVYDVLMLS